LQQARVFLAAAAAEADHLNGRERRPGRRRAEAPVIRREAIAVAPGRGMCFVQGQPLLGLLDAVVMKFVVHLAAAERGEEIPRHVFRELAGVDRYLRAVGHGVVVVEIYSQRKRHVDLLQVTIHIAVMDFDISHLLEQWDYKPGEVIVRKFKDKEGREKIQLRVDLGILQMNAEGRPDGKRPFGHASLFDYYQSRLHKHLAANHGSAEEFRLLPEDCSKLQLEALQYHHRYICLLQLKDYAGVVRDAERNLAVFNFAGKHAASEELAWSLQQFQPQLMMILSRARAMQALETEDYGLAIEIVEQGLESIRVFYRNREKSELIEQSGELVSLENWLSEIRARRPLSARERLEQALSEAVQREDYEKAAQVRDALRNLKSQT